MNESQNKRECGKIQFAAILLYNIKECKGENALVAFGIA
jgi:hypothetical protein